MKIWTVGHSNHSPEKFVSLLKAHEITMLVDVRSTPRSRFAHFNRDNIMKIVRGNEVDYRYGGLVLGGLSDISVKSQLFVAKMEKIVEMAGEGERVAMMCSEGKFWECHRAGKLTAWLHRNRPDIETLHITPDASLVDAKQGEPKVLDAVFWHEYKPKKLL